MAGSAASASLEGFVYMAMNSMQQASLNFVGQNYGAGKVKNISKIVKICLLYVTLIGAVLGAIVLLFRQQFLGLYLTDTVAMDFGVMRMKAVLCAYFLCGCVETMIGALRGFGYSTLPMFVSIIGICGLRILWIKTVFKKFTTLMVLYLSWPASWTVTLIPLIISYVIIKKKTENSIKYNKKSYSEL